MYAYAPSPHVGRAEQETLILNSSRDALRTTAAAARNCAAFFEFAQARPQSRVAEYSGAGGLQSPSSLFDAV